MSLGFGVRVLVLSLLAFGHDANALRDKSEGISGIGPLFSYPRRRSPAFVSQYESSAQPGGFLGTQSGNGPVDGYSRDGSVSSYVPSSQILRKSPKNSQQPPQTNTYGNGVLWTNSGNLDLVPQQKGYSIESGIASSSAIIMQSDPQPSAFNLGYPQNWLRTQESPPFKIGFPTKAVHEQSTSDTVYPQELPTSTMIYPQEQPTSNLVYPQKPPRPQELPTSNTGYPQKPPMPQELPTSNTGYPQKPPMPQELPTSNTGYPQKPPRPQGLPTSNTGYPQKPPMPQELPTSNTGYPQELPTSNLVYPQKPPMPQELPTSNTGYPQKPPMPQELPTSNTGCRRMPPRPQGPPTFNTGYLQTAPRPQELPTFNTGYLQKPLMPQQLTTLSSVYQPHKLNPQKGVFQTKAGMWDLVSGSILPPPRPQKLPTSNTGNLQKPPRPQQSNSIPGSGIH
uniref:formin-like protein 14 isoform X5 n=1 Tax=Gasterosteus aculeatus aculeatus TaxID=481459 RepID=UPI001A99D49A|nr:formin-like protein 14 isoform X5 [Gasterosteus aculeatus aculeatus]